VHGADGKRHSGGSRKEQLELAGDLDDEKTAKRSDVEKTNERSDQGNGEDGANVITRGAALTHHTETVHGRKGSNEDTTSATGTSGSSLNDRVFLGTEEATNEWNLATGLLEELEDAIAEDGTKDVGAEGEAGLETCTKMVSLCSMATGASVRTNRRNDVPRYKLEAQTSEPRMQPTTIARTVTGSSSWGMLASISRGL